MARAEADDVGSMTGVGTHQDPTAVDALLSSPVAVWVQGRANGCHRDDLEGVQLVSSASEECGRGGRLHGGGSCVCDGEKNGDFFFAFFPILGWVTYLRR